MSFQELTPFWSRLARTPPVDYKTHSTMKTALTIGNFDGVHRGHRALVDAVTAWRRAHGGATRYKTVVVSFEPHPVEVLRPGTIVPRLSDPIDKVERLQSLGIDEVHMISFTPEFARMTAREFFDQVLVRELDAAFVAWGHDFNFGHKREGTPELILKWCGEKKIEAKLIEAVECDGDVVSSSRIRRLIEEGQLVSAARLLGRDYAITDEVKHGDKRGRLLGFPTANLVPTVGVSGAPCLPARGVYLSSATVEGRTFPSLTNVGVKPTLSAAGQLTVETHLLDFEEDLYGKSLTVEFRDRLREEKRFAGLDELRQQIQLDMQIARARIVTK